MGFSIFCTTQQVSFSELSSAAMEEYKRCAKSKLVSKRSIRKGYSLFLLPQEPENTDWAPFPMAHKHRQLWIQKGSDQLTGNRSNPWFLCGQREGAELYFTASYPHFKRFLRWDTAVGVLLIWHVMAIFMLIPLSARLEATLPPATQRNFSTTPKSHRRGIFVWNLTAKVESQKGQFYTLKWILPCCLSDALRQGR